jgi:hypothetical protein
VTGAATGRPGFFSGFAFCPMTGKAGFIHHLFRPKRTFFLCRIQSARFLFKILVTNGASVNNVLVKFVFK